MSRKDRTACDLCVRRAKSKYTQQKDASIRAKASMTAAAQEERGRRQKGETEREGEREGTEEEWRQAVGSAEVSWAAH